MEKFLDIIKREPVYTRLFAAVIALTTGIVLYFRFWDKFLSATAESYIMAFATASGSAFLLDRVIVRSRDLRKKSGKYSLARVIVYGGLLVTVLGVVILDRGAEVFVMKNHRVEALANDRNAKIDQVKALPSIKARENAVNALRAQYLQAVKEDSVNARHTQGDARKQLTYYDNRKGELRAAIRKAQRDSSMATLTRLQRDLAEIERAADAIILSSAQGYKGARQNKILSALNREDSLLTIEVNREVERIVRDSETITTAGIEDNPVKFILEKMPSIILLLIVIGLFLSAHLVEMKETESNFVEPTNEITALETHERNLNLGGHMNTTLLMQDMVGQFEKRLKEAQSKEIDPDKPFKRNDVNDACEWLEFRVLSGTFKAKYEDQNGGDFSAACARAGVVKGGPNFKKRSTLYRNSVLKAQDMIARNDTQAIANRLKELERFKDSENGATALALTMNGFKNIEVQHE